MTTYHWLLWDLYLYPYSCMLKWEEKWTAFEIQSPISRFWIFEADIVGFPSLGQVVFCQLATPSFPHHIFMTSPAAKEDHYCHARMISHLHLWTHPGLLSVYISHQSPSLWMMKAASLLGHLRAIGRVLRNPSESCRLPSAHSENGWDQSIWWTFDLLEGPCTCIKLETEWLIGCFCSHRISWFMCKIFCKCDHLEVKVGLMQVY